MSNDRLSLLLWLESEEGKKTLEEAKRLKEVIINNLKGRGASAHLSHMRFTLHCEPEMFLSNSFHPGSTAYKHDEAVTYALKYGSEGWWTFDALIDFAEGKGAVFYDAMWKLGFKPHQTKSGRWVRKTKEDKSAWSHGRCEISDKSNSPIYAEIDPSEQTRLSKLLVLPNKNDGPDRTYEIVANNRGMIYVELIVNPFSATKTEDLQTMFENLNNRGHIGTEQDGFTIKAVNVKLGEEASGVYIKATKPDNPPVECVWPTITPAGNIYTLSSNLSERLV